MTQPSLFIGHGAPTLLIEHTEARDFLLGLAGRFPKPKAILVISAHFNARVPVITSAAWPETIHDFGGFPDVLYQQQYPAPGDPALAARIAESLQAAGFPAVTHDGRGLDHGAWIPLMLAYPKADIPVLQLSISMSQSPEWHYRLGQALQPLREDGVMIMGSGSVTHNLRAVFSGSFRVDSPEPEWVSGFADWLADRIEAGDHEAILSSVQTGPHGHENHPTMDHILPLFVALGAGGNGPSHRLHDSTTYGVIAMDAYSFGEAA